MSWIVTNTGKQFDFRNIDADNICLQDIAHALSYQCRYNGHCHLFYSTAEHSLNIANYIFQQNEGKKGKALVEAQLCAKQALLHDAVEAYMGDVVRPMKEVIPAIQKLENKIQSTIFKKYGLPTKLRALVKECDTRILFNEKTALFPASHPDWGWHMEPLEGVEIRCFTPADIYPMYYAVLLKLFGEYE